LGAVIGAVMTEATLEPPLAVRDELAITYRTHFPKFPGQVRLRGLAHVPPRWRPRIFA
jgi:hypothetical protein